MEEADNQAAAVGDTKLQHSVYLLLDDDSPNDHHHQVDAFYQEVVDYVETLAHGYIWNNDKFNISKPKPSTTTGKDDSTRIFVCTSEIDFGDNVEDEWFCVYLLFELTRKFSKK